MPHRLGRHAFALSLVFLALAPAGAQSPLWLPRVFADHMVVQRDAPVPVWGRDKPGAQVTVTLGKVGANAVADKRGTWRATLPATPAGGPFDLTVKGSDTRVFHDVLVGEVWLCSGQSNMEMGVGLVRRAKEEIAAANHPRIRLCSIPRTVAGEPESDVPASWRVCSPQTLGKDGWGGFSAAGYFFGRELLQKLDVPIGLIDSTWGGTRIEPWTPPQGFAKVESLRKVGEEVARKHHGYKTGLPARLLAVEGWIEATRKALADGSNLPPAPTLPRHPTRDARAPTGLFNGMIHPLAPFAIRGAIWYQGEANVGDGMAYRDKMQALIGGWREVWGQGDFPFYFVQIAPFTYGRQKPDRLPQLWEAQTAAMAIPNTGMVVTTDIADLKDIHPKDKQTVGKRLALWALARTYGLKDVVCCGPIYKSMKVEGNKIRITFDHIGGGLAIRGRTPRDRVLEWFDIAGKDRKFEKAYAELQNDTIVVWSDVVPEPLAVRYAWHMTAEPRLMNKEGLPASPFRTDTW